jgi:hypothetical protein
LASFQSRNHTIFISNGSQVAFYNFTCSIANVLPAAVRPASEEGIAASILQATFTHDKPM